MADLTRNNPQTRPWLPPPLRQLPFTYIHTPLQFSCMAQLSPFFHHLSPSFFRRPPVFPPPPPQGFIPPPGFTSTMPFMNINNLLSGYGAGSRFWYQNLALPHPVLQVNIFLQTRSSEQPWHQNRVLPYQPRIFGPVEIGTGVFHPPDMNASNNVTLRSNRRRRRRRRRRRNNNRVVEESPQRSTNCSQGDGLELDMREECPQNQSYEMILPNEWPY